MSTFSRAPQLLAYPMHGMRKLLQEGYRTRDGHIIEWSGHLLSQTDLPPQTGGVDVVSRPEPRIVPSRRSRRPVARGTRGVDTLTWRLPDLRHRRRWWPTSAELYPRITPPATTPAIVWNPFAALAPAGSCPFGSDRTTVLDLLDDWTAHFAFTSIRVDVERAYAAAFAAATHVTANGAGTESLARRFGRDDVRLIPNGCDAEHFRADSLARGPLTVGYVGKIGRRLDLEGVIAVVRALPSVHFVFAGPILDAEYRPALRALANATLTGDVHYNDLPALLQSFDVGWIPHRVGEFEVGGDVIKTYEYRAAGLPVLATPFCSVTRRGLDHVDAVDIAGHADWLRAAERAGPRLPRKVMKLPLDTSWRSKTKTMLGLLGLPLGESSSEATS